MISSVYRLTFLSWIANKCANQWKLVLIAVALCAITASAILSGTKGVTTNVAQTTTVLVAVVLLYRLIWEGATIFDVASRSSFKLKRLIYRYFRSGMPLGGAASVSVRSTLIISKHFTSIQFRRRDQHFLADKIVAGISNGSKLFVIEGQSGVGKTSTAIIILDRIITDIEVSERARDIRYCDFASGPDGVRDLINRGNSGLLEQTFLILDNFHRIAPEALRDFSEFLRDGQPPCQGLLILTQSHDFMAFCPQKNVNAIKIAEKGGTLYKLFPPKPREIQQIFSTSKDHDHIAKALDQLGVSYDAPTRWVAHASMERAYQMALEDGNQIVQTLLLAPSNDNSLPNLPNSLLSVIATISALSLHRGVFPRKELEICFEKLAPGGFFNSDLRRLRANFRQLRQAGLVLEAIGRRRVFVFHQTLAEHFRSRFGNSAAFMHVFQAVGAEIRRMDWVKNDPLMRWLFAVELADISSIQSDFSAAMMSGAFGQMRKTLSRNSGSGSDLFLGYVQGVLAEKVGEWNDARHWLRMATESDCVQVNDWAKAKLVQIEAVHGNNVRHELETICNNLEIHALYRISAQYWLIHMDAHLGEFKLDELSEVVEKIEDGLENFEAEDPYQLLHLARRAYFDLVRFHYLTGTTDDKFLGKHSSREIARHLSRKLVTFDAYCEKFLYGHRIHYDYIFQLRVLQQRPTPFNISDQVQPVVSSDLSELISVALEHYRLSVKIFTIFGDKTAEYILPRMYELELMHDNADLDGLLPKLNEYKKFIDSSGLVELSPYPYIYYFKLHIKKAQQLLLKIRTLCDGSLASAEHDIEMRHAHDALEQASSSFENSGNKYGFCMCLLFGGTLAHLRSEEAETAQCKIADAQLIAKKFGYQRILSTINRIKEKPLTPGNVYDAILYFPFVHQ